MKKLMALFKTIDTFFNKILAQFLPYDSGVQAKGLKLIQIKIGCVLLLLITIILLLFLSGKTKKEENLQPYAVQKKWVENSLYFNGTIQPLQEFPLTVPLNAVIDSMPFTYGQEVKKGEVLFVLRSNELQKQYDEALTEYLKAKDSYYLAKVKFTGTEELWQSGLLARNNYLGEKSSLNTTHIALLQAKNKLLDLIRKIDDQSLHGLEKLNLSDFEQIKKNLMAEHNHIKIKAPHSGILLYPPASGDEKSAKLAVGSSVKAGDVLGLIGDLNGLHIEIDVPEVDIGKIQRGMLATVTGVAFGNEVLRGKLVAINSQASNTANAGLPSFNALIEINPLTPAQQQLIKIGMSANIELKVIKNQQLVVPLTAIKEVDDKPTVRVKLSNGKILRRTIAIQEAGVSQAIIASGLQEGDEIVYD